MVRSVEELNVLPDEDDSDCCLECFNVPLRHGINEYNLTAQVCIHYERSLLTRQIFLQLVKLHESLPCVACPERNMSRNFFVGPTVSPS